MATLTFIVLAVLASIALGLVLSRPLWRAATPSVHRLHRTHRLALRQLERALHARAIDQPLYDAQRRQLSARLTDSLLATDAPPPAGRGTRAVALSVIIAVPLIVAAGYLYVGDPTALSPSATAATPSVAQMVDGLAAQLRTQPDNLSGWVMLGRSYLVLGRYADAAQAYAEAHRLSSADPDIEANYAEALVLQDPQALTGKAAALIEASLAGAPDNAQALWLGGLLAQARADKDLAIQRWSTLLAQQGLPEDFRSAVQQHLQALQSGGPAVTPVATAPAQARDNSERVNAPGAGVAVQVALSPHLAARADADATLFVFARAAGQSAGPPLAVRRLTVGALPAQIELTGADAVMTGGKLDPTQALQLTARVTLHGGVDARAGDLEGQAHYGGDGKPVRLIIDRIVP